MENPSIYPPSLHPFDHPAIGGVQQGASLNTGDAERTRQTLPGEGGWLCRRQQARQHNTGLGFTGSQAVILTTLSCDGLCVHTQLRTYVLVSVSLLLSTVSGPK